MKHTIRAFALGLATATALLTFTYYQTNDQNESKALTDQEAITHLESNDYHVLSQSSFEDLKEEKKESQPDQADSKRDDKKQSETKEKDQKDTSQQPYSLTIEPGMLSSSISDELKKAGILEDKAKFEVFLKDHEYSRAIQIGTYSITRDMSYEEIAKKITGQ
ncbi:endolytic transglycosylase MltG [Pontibacillus marinus]|uniref:Aminodeoxychorismate lyase n=1 Tax=Pontibacillus marinus BH030004 = DSM 16465 TaxID=1385511 RepID=A0A0A5FZ27_9BACI|nr:endolytic transglycosylase MltG [Pontibacillus marinus]KGX85034.1 hypothetical protein N783_15540 [Pontibacillus marinus BH030004 = DSM 16465]